MSAPAQNPQHETSHDQTLAVDERWLLVQRILLSEGFQRAAQLRKILVYVSRSAILNPEIVLHEYEIACDVLDRRKDFDPTNDNIVRAQFTHLRRKLERYFSEVGTTEVLYLTIPRGSYIPVFTQNHALKAVAPSVVPTAGEQQITDIPPTSETPHQQGTTLWIRLALLVAVAVCGVLSMVLLYMRSSTVKSAKNSPGNGFAAFMSKYEGNVAVVIPDTSTMMINFITDIDISAADYTSNDFPQRQIETVKDPEVRRVLTQLSKKRNTTASEARIGYEFVDALELAGAHGTVRYARDLHVRDLNEGNTVLIGSQRSDPWVSLFVGKTNFQYSRSGSDGQYVYRNMSPLPGEQSTYPVSTVEEKNRVNYVDIAFMPNSTKSGFVLLVVGSDSEANEAAAKLLLHGRLPTELASLLARKDLRSFEIFLRGKHITGESEDSLELVSVRPNN